MAKLYGIYKCQICGNIVEVFHEGAGELVCCNEPMKFFDEKSADSATEKHVPLIEKTANGYKITVGSTIHPMTAEHYIEWIELLADGRSYKKYLKPGDQPIAEFCVDAKDVSAREYCNVHGLWRAN